MKKAFKSILVNLRVYVSMYTVSLHACMYACVHATREKLSRMCNDSSIHPEEWLRRIVIIWNHIAHNCRSTLERTRVLLLISFLYVYAYCCLVIIQWQATKFILSDFSTDYKFRLKSLLLIPHTYWLEIQDLMPAFQCIKAPPDNSDILRPFYVQYIRASNLNHLQHSFCRPPTVHHVIWIE